MKAALKLGIIVVFFIFLISFAPNIFAATITFSSPSANLNSDFTYPVNLTVTSKVTDGTVYYLRGVFFLNGTTNYCGGTLNSTNDWYEGPYTTNNGWQNLPSITIKNSSWSGSLNAKFDYSDSACLNNGNYTFKIIRYTTSGSSSTDETVNPVSLNIIVPTSTPTPLPTPTFTPIPTIPSSIENSNSNNITPTYFGENENSDTPTIDDISYANDANLDASTSSTSSMDINNQLFSDVLGTTSANDKNKITKVDFGDYKKSNNAILLWIGISIILVSCGILGYKFLWKKGLIKKFW